MMKSSICGIEFTMCDAFIDQGKYIGDDVIGFKCCKIATVKTKDGTDLCDTCFQLLSEEPQRVTIPGIKLAT